MLTWLDLELAKVKAAGHLVRDVLGLVTWSRKKQLKHGQHLPVAARLKEIKDRSFAFSCLPLVLLASSATLVLLVLLLLLYSISNIRTQFLQVSNVETAAVQESSKPLMSCRDR